MTGTRVENGSREEINRILSEIYTAITAIENRITVLEGKIVTGNSADSLRR